MLNYKYVFDDLLAGCCGRMDRAVREIEEALQTAERSSDYRAEPRKILPWSALRNRTHRRTRRGLELLVQVRDLAARRTRLYQYPRPM